MLQIETRLFVRRGRVATAAVLLAALTCLIGGCVQGPVFIPEAQRRAIDRRLVEYPAGMVMKEVATGLTGPVDLEIDPNGTIIIAESGSDDNDPRIYGIRKDGTRFNIYPPGQRIPFNLPGGGFKIYAPIGGTALYGGEVYVSHRDSTGMGVITAFKYDGTHRTVVGELPARGDNGVTDLAIGPPGLPRLWFGVGSATNSGVVGLDNWWWAKPYGQFCDRPWVQLRLTGYHFMSKNPDAGLLGGPELAVTGPFQAFGQATASSIAASKRPSGAIYSVDLGGGPVRVEAHGIHNPRGIAFNLSTPFMTNDGMELRGTRPIADDPDALLKITSFWYGWPDYSTDLQPIAQDRFQPPREMALKNGGYDEVWFLIDQKGSNNGEGLLAPDKFRETLVQGVFPSLSGAQKMEFVPGVGPFREYQGDAIVALSGDRAPFAIGGGKYRQLREPVGFMVVRVDMSSHKYYPLVRNTTGLPLSKISDGAGVLERPWSVRFDSKGNLYILDFGQMDVRMDGREKVKARSGKVFVIEAAPAAETAPQK